MEAPRIRMQDRNGDATCNSDKTSVVENPCPSAVVEQMVRDDTAGTSGLTVVRASPAESTAATGIPMRISIEPRGFITASSSTLALGLSVGFLLIAMRAIL